MTEENEWMETVIENCEQSPNGDVMLLCTEVRRLQERVAELERALNAESESARMAQDRIERLLPNAQIGRAVLALPDGCSLSLIIGTWILDFGEVAQFAFRNLEDALAKAAEGPGLTPEQIKRRFSDAQLGRAVRALPPQHKLMNYGDHWYAGWHAGFGKQGATPEAALGLSEEAADAQ